MFGRVTSRMIDLLVHKYFVQKDKPLFESIFFKCFKMIKNNFKQKTHRMILNRIFVGTQMVKSTMNVEGETQLLN